MPKGPKGEKRPADVIGAAVKVMQIATRTDTGAPPPRSMWTARTWRWKWSGAGW